MFFHHCIIHPKFTLIKQKGTNFPKIQPVPSTFTITPPSISVKFLSKSHNRNFAAPQIALFVTACCIPTKQVLQSKQMEARLNEFVSNLLNGTDARG